MNLFVLSFLLFVLKWSAWKGLMYIKQHFVARAKTRLNIVTHAQ